MAMSTNTSLWLALGVVLVFIATPAAAFGAGDVLDVAKIEGLNYRHGDIENTLLELLIAAGGRTKFEKMDVKRVYFGNWLRDYSQAIDVGGLKQLPAETIRILLWALSFLTFGYATGEFEVTAERLGCYRPEEHIDNPKDYADNEDARQYDQRLRGPVDEGKELAVDPQTGLKVYIASENAGVETSAGLVRRLFEKSIEHGRKYKESDNKDDFYEALRLLGTGLHCLEDFSAHSNYTELALRELGVDAFPHVGKQTEVDIQGKKVFPVVTGTFGMTDFLHSLVGELGDKVAQSEVEEMESKLTSASEEDQNNDQFSVLKEILDKVPWEMLGGDNKPDTGKAEELKANAAAKAEEAKQNPLDPNATLGGVNIEEAKQTAQQTLKDMYPILEFHDQVMKGVTEVISKVPGLDDLLENMSGALQIFIFSLLAPYIKPIIAQARIELKSSSQGVLKSSEKGQYEVFEDDNSSNPTHSMLSKDHFSNVLNPIAGKVACATVRFVVPQIVDCWGDGGKDVGQTINNILQVFHHPALRDENKEGQKAMFETVKEWYEDKSESEKQELNQQLSEAGVKAGDNHQGEGAEGGHSHSHGALPKKKKDDGFVPSAQDGAGLLSDLTGGLAGMVMQESGLGDTLGLNSESGRQSGRTNQSSGYGGNSSSRRNDNEDSYGSSGRQETSSYGRQEESGNSYGQSGRQHGRQEESSGNSYGQSGREETSSYGRQEQSGYGRQEQSSRNERTNNDDEPSYGNSSSRRNNDSEETGYGNSSSRLNTDSEENTYGSSGRQQQSSYGRNNDSEETGYGNSSSRRNNNNDEEENSYGSLGRQ
jgi:hypothetical protein